MSFEIEFMWRLVKIVKPIHIQQARWNLHVFINLHTYVKISSFENIYFPPTWVKQLYLDEICCFHVQFNEGRNYMFNDCVCGNKRFCHAITSKAIWHMQIFCYVTSNNGQIKMCSPFLACLMVDSFYFYSHLKYL